MITPFVAVSSFVLFFGGLIWSKDRAPNVAIKAVLLALGFWGGFVLFTLAR